MKKTAMLLAFALVVSVLAGSAMAYSAPADGVNQGGVMPLVDTDYIDFVGNSGTRYIVYFAQDIVGYNHIVTGSKVKVCQAMCAVAGYPPFDTAKGEKPDGIFGPNSYSSVYSAQGSLGVTQDGVCGKNTWHALNSYMAYNGKTNVMKSYL